MAESLVYTCEEARRLLGKCSKDTFYTAIKEGKIPAIKLSERKIIIPKSLFHAWLEGRLKNELARTDSAIIRAKDREVVDHDNNSITS